MSPLRGCTFLMLGDQPSALYAADLLTALGAAVVAVGAEPRSGQVGLERLPVLGAINASPQPLQSARYPVVRLSPDPPAAVAWARCGAAALTGRAQGPPLAPAGAVATRLRGAAAALELLSAALGSERVVVDGPALLGERAALTGARRGGDVSVGRSAHLLQAGDGWLAVNLPRPDDVALAGAWLRRPLPADPWPAVAQAVMRLPAGAAAARAQELGLAVAVIGFPAHGSGDHCPRRPLEPGATIASEAVPPTRYPVRREHPLLLDLSVLWAGPLATALAARAGARVVKVESPHRPDGARRGHQGFFDLLNSGKESLALDLRRSEDRSAFARLLDRAAVIVESARPRALAQLGMDPVRLSAERPALSWLGITGYGRSGPSGQRVAFGDDAAAAAGLLAWDAAGPVFCADAAADPVTGLHAAVVLLALLASDQGAFVDLAMRDVAACVAADGGAGSSLALDPDDVAPPRTRPWSAPARPLDADRAALAREFGFA